MKRLILLAAVIGMSSVAVAQVPRRVLVEKFTNTGCPPCAVTDPIFEDFENHNLGKIAVVKYHTSGPDPSDPFYNDTYMKNPDDANKRAGQSYYAVPGVPHVFFDGLEGVNPSVGREAMEDLVADRYDITSPFEMTVKREVVGDSLFANVTIKAVGTVPTEAMRFAVVFTERYNPFKGSNGSPFHSDIVRDVVPGFTSGGDIATTGKFPAFTIAAGQTKTLRYGTKILAGWNVDMFGAVAFVQDLASREVYQSGWSFPEAYIEGEGSFSVINGSKSNNVTIFNPTPNPLKVKVNTVASNLPSNWALSVPGTDQSGIVTIDPNSSKEISLTMTVTGGAKGSGIGTAYLSRVNDDQTTDAIFGVYNTYFGAQTTELVVDAGSGIYKDPTIADLRALNYQVGVITNTDLIEKFDDWSQFKYIFYMGGLTTGLYTNDGSWDLVSDYLASGGNILVSTAVGPSAYKTSGNASILRNWRENLGVEPDTTWQFQNGWNGVVGQEGDPITGDFLDQFNMQYNLPYLQTVGIAKGSNATPILYSFRGDTIGIKAIRGTGKSVFLGAGLEFFANAERTELTKKIIDWFNGVQSVQVSPIATSFDLKQNFPNPFNPSTTIEFSITEPAAVTLVVRDMMGREVATLIDFQMHDRGTYSQKFNASELASGTYMYELTAGSQKISKKLTLNK